MARLIRHPTVEAVGLRVKKAWDWMVAQVVTALLSVAKRLPPDRSTAMAARAGRFLAPILPRTALAKRNLSLAFPDKTASEISLIVRDVWGNVARTIAEYVLLDRLMDFDPERPGEGRIEVDGVDQFLALRDSGRPAIIFTAHTGNWEILPVAAAAYGLEVTALFRPPNNPYLAERVLKARRTEGGHLVPSRAGAAWSLARVLERDGVVGLLADQAFTRGPHITFMGRPATANPLAAKLARQFDCDIHPARCVRLPGGRFRLELGGAIEQVRRPDGSVDVPGTTAAIAAIIEGWVSERPAEWLWLHDRWKIKGKPRAKWARD